MNSPQADVYAVVMGGGQGTRLWPLSRRRQPKQFLSLCPGGATLLQEAVRRAADVAGGIEQVLVVAPLHQAELVWQQLPALPWANLILEPVGGNTAACIGLAAEHLAHRAGEAVMAVLPADHMYDDEAQWTQALQTAIQFARDSHRLVTLGLTPAYPSSSYGYLKTGASLVEGGSEQIFAVEQFIEKPELEEARSFLQEGSYLWNTGTFAWRVSAFQDALRQFLPALYQGLKKIGGNLENFELVSQIYPTLENISVDYGVMEKAAGVAVVRGNYRRIDLGNLANLGEIWDSDPQGNSATGQALILDSQQNILYTDSGLIGVIGVENLVVVRQGDVVLVCPKERAAEVKQLVAKLAENGLEQYL